MSTVAFPSFGSRQKAAGLPSVSRLSAGTLTLMGLLAMLALAAGGCSSHWWALDVAFPSASEVKAMVRAYTDDPVIKIWSQKQGVVNAITGSTPFTAERVSGFFRFTRAAGHWSVEMLLSHEDIVQIMVLIRKETSEPLVGITPQSDGSVNVETGYVRGPVAGRGLSFRLERIPHGWVISSRGQWVS